MTWVRLFGRIHPSEPDKRIEQIAFRVRAVVPGGARVDVTDIQAQPGKLVTGWTLHPSDLGVKGVAGWNWRNAVVSGDQQLVITADVDSASPTVWDIRGVSPGVRIDQYYFGAVGGGARVDGEKHTATHGAGIPPHLTERADVTIPMHVDGRVLVCSWHRGIVTPGDDEIDAPAAPAHIDGPVTTSHPVWGQALAAHPGWTDLVAAHPDWS